MFRFSLSTLLVSVLAVGLGCAALLNPTPLIEKVALTATIAMLGIATLAALYLPKSTRAFYGGFAVAGWLYFAIVTVPLSAEPADFGMTPQRVKDRLLTTDCLRLLDPILAKPAPAPHVPKQIRIGITRTGEGIYSLDRGRSYPAQPVLDRSAFYNIGHLLFVLLFGVVGGTLAHGWQKAVATDGKSKPESKGN